MIVLLAPSPAPAPSPTPQLGGSASWVDLQSHHLMTPTAVAIVLMLALVIDWMSFGPNSIRDRLAFLLAVPAVFEGFNDGPLDRWTVGALTSAINTSKTAAEGSYIAGADTQHVIAAMVGLLWIYALGCLMPDKWSSKLGPYARLAFSAGGRGGAVPVVGVTAAGAKHRLNWRLWICAVLIGVLCELPGGLVGGLMLAFVSVLDTLAAALPSMLFGGA